MPLAPKSSKTTTSMTSEPSNDTATQGDNPPASTGCLRFAPNPTYYPLIGKEKTRRYPQMCNPIGKQNN